MERELQRQRQAVPGSGPEGGSSVEETRASLDAILAEADRILDELRPVHAEDYLQQNRQRGGE
jgi:hypothetical protein